MAAARGGLGNAGLLDKAGGMIGRITEPSRWFEGDHPGREAQWGPRAAGTAGKHA